MRLGDLTILILNLNAVIDSGDHRDVSLNEAKQHIEKGDVFEWLETRFKGAVDLSLHDRACRKEIGEGLRSILEGYSGDERRKWGVQNNGICLLVAWTNELIQQEAFDSE